MPNNHSANTQTNIHTLGTYISEAYIHTYILTLEESSEEAEPKAVEYFEDDCFGDEVIFKLCFGTVILVAVHLLGDLLGMYVCMCNGKASFKKTCLPQCMTGKTLE